MQVSLWWAYSWASRDQSNGYHRPHTRSRLVLRLFGGTLQGKLRIGETCKAAPTTEAKFKCILFRTLAKWVQPTHDLPRPLEKGGSILFIGTGQFPLLLVIPQGRYVVMRSGQMNPYREDVWARDRR
jgi:hypothetical protein